MQIKLVEKDEVLQDDELIAKELNKFFENALSTLNMWGYLCITFFEYLNV